MWLLLLLSAFLWGLLFRYQSLLDAQNPEGYGAQIKNYLNLTALTKDKSEVETVVYDKITFDAGLIKAIIAVAPLMGLLGTVGGMIETFASLGTMEMFKSGGGIAGGISQALLTTQLGLIVAVPGILYLKLIERKKTHLMSVFKEQIYASQADQSIGGGPV